MFSVDFITHLPLLNGYKSIATFVDTFTKHAHFVPCSSTITACNLAKLHISIVYRLHGLRSTMIGNIDKLYTSQYFRYSFEQLGTTLNLSTAAHPQTDGQTEITHRTIEQILRYFCYANQAQWLYHLPLAKFDYNNTECSTTGFCPFYSCYGFHPQTPISLSLTTPRIDVMETIHTTHSLIHENIKIAKAFQKHCHGRFKQSPHAFAINDKVVEGRDSSRTVRHLHAGFGLTGFRTSDVMRIRRALYRLTDKHS
jgi:hypothetical protein